ncbi:LPS assembly lipoprotein LptE [Bacteroidota bacterium]
MISQNKYYINKFLIKLSSLMIILLFAFSYSSCFTFRISGSGATITDEMKTFSVSYFPCRAPLASPTLGTEFTEKLKDKFSDQTSLELVNTVGHLHFEGEIKADGYKTEPIGVQANEIAAQTRLTIQIQVIFVNEKDSEKNFDRVFSHYTDFSSDLSLDEVQNELNEEIIDKIIEDIFNAAVVNW